MHLHNRGSGTVNCSCTTKQAAQPTAFAPVTHQDWAVLLLEDGTLADMLAVLDGLNNVSKLSIDMGGTTHTLQGTAGLLNLATLNQTVGGVGNDDGTQEEDEGWDNGQTHRQAPATVFSHVLCAVVDPLGNPDTDGGCHLEHDVEGSTSVSGGDLRKVEGHSLQETIEAVRKTAMLLEKLDGPWSAASVTSTYKNEMEAIAAADHP